MFVKGGFNYLNEFVFLGIYVELYEVGNVVEVLWVEFVVFGKLMWLWL